MSGKAEEIKVESSSSKTEPAAKKTNWLRPLMLIAGVVIVLVLLVVLIKSNSHKNVAFSIDGKNYSIQDVTTMANFARLNNSETKQQAAKTIYDLYRTQAASQKANIVPTSSEIQAAYQSLTPPKNNLDKQYDKLFAYNLALSSSYGRYASGDDEGNVFIFSFDRYVLGAVAGQPAVPNHNNAGLIQQDNNYALQQAQTDYSLYKSGKISASDLTTKIAGDTTLAASNSVGLSFNSTEGNLIQQVGGSDIYNYVVSQTKPGLSNIRIGQVPTKFPTAAGDYANGYYYFVDLKKASKIVVNPGLLVENQENKLKATYYGI